MQGLPAMVRIGCAQCAPPARPLRPIMLFAISSDAVGTEIRMKQPDGSNHLCRGGAPIEKGCPAGSHGTLRAVLATMEGCRAPLAVSAEHETADLLLMAILQLRMRLEGVSEAELKLLCESIAAGNLPTEAQLTPKRPRGRRRLPALRLVK